MRPYRFDGHLLVASFRQSVEAIDLSFGVNLFEASTEEFVVAAWLRYGGEDASPIMVVNGTWLEDLCGALVDADPLNPILVASLQDAHGEASADGSGLGTLDQEIKKARSDFLEVVHEAFGQSTLTVQN